MTRYSSNRSMIGISMRPPDEGLSESPNDVIAVRESPRATFSAMPDPALPPLADQLAESWAISARIDLYMLDAIDEDALDLAAPSKGRTVREVFVHVHNVRLMWLDVAAKDLMAGLAKLDK